MARELRIATSPDGVFFFTAAQEISRGIRSGGPNKEFPAPCATTSPRVQSSASLLLRVSALSSSKV